MESRATKALVAVRLIVSALIFTHGMFRLLSGGVAGFGGFLDSQHFPAGLAIAWWITLAEIIGSTVLASGRVVRPLAIYFAGELTMGIILVHRHDGWFVVGGGRNGMEYSVLLISLLLVVAWSASRELPRE